MRKLITKFFYSSILLMGFMITSTMWAYIVMVVLKKLRLVV